MEKHITPLEFGQMMIGHKNAYPLEVVGSIQQLNDEGNNIYLPVVVDYVTGEEYTSAVKEGYGFNSRGALCEFIGLCWDLAEDHLKETAKYFEDKPYTEENVKLFDAYYLELKKQRCS